MIIQLIYSLLLKLLLAGFLAFVTNISMCWTKQYEITRWIFVDICLLFAYLFVIFREFPILFGTADELGTSPLKPEDHILLPPWPPGTLATSYKHVA